MNIPKIVEFPSGPHLLLNEELLDLIGNALDNAILQHPFTRSNDEIEKASLIIECINKYLEKKD